IHCNAAGLRQALALMGDVDDLICLGDSIYEYRFSNEVVGLLKERGARVILGNHEEYFFGPQGERARARDGVDPALTEWLASRPSAISRTTRRGRCSRVVESRSPRPRSSNSPANTIRRRCIPILGRRRAAISAG